MAQLTREQATTWNTGNANGFSFDVSNYVMRGEKESTKVINLCDDKYLRVTVMYTAEYRRTGGGYNMPTYQHIPAVHMATYQKSGQAYMSRGLGYWHNLGAAVPKKNYNALKQFTHDLTTEKCLELFATLTATQVNQYA